MKHDENKICCLNCQFLKHKENIANAIERNYIFNLKPEHLFFQEFNKYKVNSSVINGALIDSSIAKDCSCHKEVWSEETVDDLFTITTMPRKLDDCFFSRKD